MKTRLCTAFAILLLVCSGHAAEEPSLGFLQPEHRYHFIYAIDQESVKVDRLPTIVTVVSHAGGSWYVVKSIDRDDRYWINLTSVAAIVEIQK